MLIVWLGNPWKEYEKTRHNAWWWILDHCVSLWWGKREVMNQRRCLSATCETEYWTIHCIKPQTFMNRSGQTIAHLISEPTIIFVAHDDLDIRIGNFKIQKSVGPKMHNGLESIEQSLKSKSFWRIRIGIDNRTSDNSIPGEPYVLSNFSEEESEMLEKTFPRILSKLQLLLEDPSIL